MVGNCFSCQVAYPAKGKHYSAEVLAKYPLKDKENNMNYVLRTSDQLLAYKLVVGIL